MNNAKLIRLQFAIGTSATDARPKNTTMTWRKFVDYMTDPDEIENRPTFTGREAEDEYRAKKSRQKYICASVLPGAKRGDDGVDCRSICWLDLDAVTPARLFLVRRALSRLNLRYLEYTTPGDRHPLKGEDTRSVRFAIPTDRPMAADEIWQVNATLAHMLDVWDCADATAYQRARLMFVPHRNAAFRTGTGRTLAVDDVLDMEWEAPTEKSDRPTLSEDDLAKADENGRAIMEWCEEMGLELMPSRRGYIVECPNSANHSTDTDGTSSTAILLPNAKHPEVHFHCQHANCSGHGNINRHQHLAMRMLGVPDYLLPSPHPISRAQLAEALPLIDEEELQQLHQAENDAAADEDLYVCTDEDLEDEPSRPQFTQHDPIIEGLLNFRSTWYAAGGSNIGKSFHILGTMAAVAAGIQFAGKAVIPAHCFYFDAEAPEESKRRKKALQIKYQSDLSRLHIIDTAGAGIDITTPAGCKKCVRLINDLAGEEPVGIITFDSLNATTAFAAEPFDENNAADMGKVVACLKDIARETGGSPGVIHHPAKSNNGNRTARGSGALHAAVDAAFFLEQPDPDKEHQLNFYHEKARFGMRQSPRGFILQSCKIPVDENQSELVGQYQSTAAAPDFSKELTGFEPAPFKTTPPDETLYLVPVALAPFDADAVTPARAMANEIKEKNGKASSALYKLIEALQTLDEAPEGISQALAGSVYKKVHGERKKFQEGWREAQETGVVIPAANDDGEITGWLFKDWDCAPQQLSDSEKPPQPSATNADLED